MGMRAWPRLPPPAPRFQQQPCGRAWEWKMKPGSKGLAASHAALFLSLTISATAAERDDALTTVLVTATRYPVPSEQVLPSAFVVERSEIQRNLVMDVTDALRFRTGLE